MGAIEYPAGFSEEQKRALTAMVQGASIAAAARMAGVHRATVSRWVNEGGEFHRVLRTEQAKRLAAVRREARSIGEQAANVVADAIRAGDASVAMAVLKALGVFAEPEWTQPWGEDTAEGNQCRGGSSQHDTVTQ